MEPCGEWQAHQVRSSVLAAPLPGSCVAAAAFGSGSGSCALGWDSGRLLGARLLPLALLQVHAGLSHAPLLPPPLARMGRSRASQSLLLRAHVDLSQAPLVPLPPAHTATLPLLGRCVMVCASWGNNWQAA